MNIFEKYPDFIETDIRKDRYPPEGYNVTADRMFYRNSLSLPREKLQGKSVLDLGCCVGASGAWALENGASSYTGVELQSDFVAHANANLQKYFPTHKWTVIESSFENFFKNNIKHFDIILAFGVIYFGIHYQQFIDSLVKIGSTIIIESSHPRLQNINNESVVQYTKLNLVYEKGGGIKTTASIISIPALELIFSEYGFIMDLAVNEQLKLVDDLYLDKRFLLVFNKDRDKQPGFEVAYRNTVTSAIIPWKFDEQIANNFVSHAKKHIPDYNRVIDYSIEICKQILLPSDKIIDVGCATGETLNRLHIAGFLNLVGVDSAPNMLAKCNSKISTLLLNEHFPVDNGPYNAVLCNWTLHFIKEKYVYLKDIFENIGSGGFLILTDKTVNDGVDLQLYHNFKRSCGVTEQEIREKAESLNGVMFIDSMQWYINTLQELGFNKVSIINANFCFTTFLAIKE